MGVDVGRAGGSSRERVERPTRNSGSGSGSGCGKGKGRDLTLWQ